jgi:hypothetical protein
MNLLDFQELKLYGHLQRLGTIPPLGGLKKRWDNERTIKLFSQLLSSTSTSTKVPFVNDFILLDNSFDIT